jgi:YbgC/YbaW family acyl-CoA thioester hydrolase
VSDDGDMTIPRDGPAMGAPSPASIVVQRRIEWSDTDASGNYHNSAAFRLIENAETALLDRLGFLHRIYGRLPRAHISADFVRPLAFKDLVDVTVSVSTVGRTSVTYGFEISCRGETAVRGKTVAVLMTRLGGDPEPWPDDLRRLLLTAGPQRPELMIEG